MKQIIRLQVTLACLFSLSMISNAQSLLSTPGCYQYTVKFVCGRGDGRIVAIGQYFTAINILNANDKAVTFTKKFVAAPPNRPGNCTDPVKVTLKECQAIEINCPEIMQSVQYPPGPRPSITKGFVVIQSNRPLDIVAVHTAAGKNRYVECIHTERVPANTGAG